MRAPDDNGSEPMQDEEEDDCEAGDEDEVEGDNDDREELLPQEKQDSRRSEIRQDRDFPDDFEEELSDKGSEGEAGEGQAETMLRRAGAQVFEDQPVRDPRPESSGNELARAAVEVAWPDDFEEMDD